MAWLGLLFVLLLPFCSLAEGAPFQAAPTGRVTAAPVGRVLSGTATNTVAVIALTLVDPPVSSGEPPLGQTQDRGEIILPGGGVRLWLEIWLSGWAPSELRTWQATIDSSVFRSGLGAPLEPARQPCVDDAACVVAFGAAARCDGGLCLPAWQDIHRSNFLVRGGISAVRVNSVEFAFGSTTGLPPADLPVPDDGAIHYGGTFVLDVPPDAAGVYDIAIRPDGATFMDGATVQNIPLTLTSVRVVLPTACCISDDACVSDTASECAASGGVVVPFCGGDCDGNGIHDGCDIAFGAGDCNVNAVPDVCDPAWDGDGDGRVTLADFVLLAGCLSDPCPTAGCDSSPPPGAPACCVLADVDGDGDVDLKDVAAHSRTMESLLR